MAIKFEDIKTARELIDYTSIHGVPTDQESVCRMQDIIGHSTVEELETLANDNGRNDEHGNPDPNGSWSSGRRGTQGQFYSLIFQIWNWEEAVRFWNKTTNPDQKMLVAEVDGLRKRVKDDTKELEAWLDKFNSLAEDHEKLKNNFSEASQRLLESNIKVEEYEQENMRLKAKLYDLMTKEAVTK